MRKRASSRTITLTDFNTAIIDRTWQEACAIKINVAFYSTQSNDDYALGLSISHARSKAPGVPIILDAKRADIGNTNIQYVLEAFDRFGADAVTINPYFGQEGVQPFLDQADKGIIVLCRTSNKGAAEFQNLPVVVNNESDILALGLSNVGKTVPLYEYIAMRVAYNWNSNHNCALVVGATAPAELARVRKIVGDMQILIPGIGAQGGELEATVEAGVNSTGTGMIINSSRGIIFASNGEDFAEVAGREAKKLNDAIKDAIKSCGVAGTA